MKINKHGTYEFVREYEKALLYVYTWRIHYAEELKIIDEKQRSLAEK